MKIINIALLVLIAATNVHNASAACSCCKPLCEPLKFDGITASNAEHVISGIGGAFGAIANGNDVYITGYFNGYVYRYNSQIGNGIQQLEALRLPTGNPTFLDIHDGFLYVTSHVNSVYRKPLIGGEFELQFQQYKPVGIKWSSDGERLLVSEWETSKVHVYNYDLQRIHTFTHCATYAREISFDSNDNIRISTYTPKICIYDGKNYQLIEQTPISGASNTEGYLVHCDGSIILADRGGKLLFLDKNYQTLRTITGYASLGDVALTTDGTLYVTDISRSEIYLYKVF